MTLDQAKKLTPGQTLYHISLTNADGTPQRWRVNGKTKTWKRSPERVMVPLARGLYQHAYLTEDNLGNFVLPMPMLVITTRSGEIYKVNSEQQIIRTDMTFKPTDQWLFVGIVPKRASYLRHVVNYESLKAGLPTVRYKNGRSRYNVIDIDHGAIRLWSDSITNLQWSDR